MINLLNKLVRLNSKLYNYTAHIILLIIFFITFEMNQYFSIWFKIGFVSYILLIIYRVLTEGFLKPRFTYQAILSYLVGFNICIILGPFCIPLFLYIKSLKE